ncbi:sigma-54 interaction domain-containing protein [Bacillus sp. FJAT-29937]|uniref:sigma-54 interaction domain-containing protein n=1 Tax=Bacillus sp. FJAT-29937 TaxID=1720553 RepID=UPI00083368B4|nr:sigma 54-interacting transcriptional regulator [Bacillus sp. FJAT-29937]
MNINLEHSKEYSSMVKLLESTIAMSQDGIYVCDKNGNTLLINDALIEITNISKEQYYSHTLKELVKKNIIPNTCAYQTLKNKRKYNMVIDYFNGKKAIVSSTPVFDENNEIFCVVSNVRDITELKNLQEKLEEANRRNNEYQRLLYQNEQLLFDSNLVYQSKKMKNLISLAFRIAKNESPILLLGESGVGKDVIAQYIHKMSQRTGDFVRVNCGAIPAHLLESELFGHEKGAFTGAGNTKVGLFELAKGGTIFLDEIGDMPYELQVKILNVLQDKKIRKIGGTKTQHIDMRVIAATNLDLQSMIERNEFRKDLYYRLNVLSITIPPLRERKEDIIALTLYFFNNLEKKYKEKKHIEKNVLEWLLAYHWPGNVRELNNVVERMYHMSETKIITLDHLPQSIQDQCIHHQTHFRSLDQIEPNLPLKEAVAIFERNYISDAIKTSPTLKECANKLEIGISTLMRKKSNLGIVLEKETDRKLE